MGTNRRSFIHGTGLGLFAYTVAGTTVWLSPGDARAKGADFEILSAAEVELLEAAGDALAPGAREAEIGRAHV